MNTDEKLDTARLEWLVRNYAVLNVTPSGQWWVTSGRDQRQLSLMHDTFRAAIDDARLRSDAL